MHRRSRAGEIVDFVHLDEKRKRDVVAHELEARMGKQITDIAFAPGEQIVHAKHVVPQLEKLSAKMRSDESSATGHKNALAERVAHRLVLSDFHRSALGSSGVCLNSSRISAQKRQSPRRCMQRSKTYRRRASIDDGGGGGDTWAEALPDCLRGRLSRSAFALHQVVSDGDAQS